MRYLLVAIRKNLRFSLSSFLGRLILDDKNIKKMVGNKSFSLILAIATDEPVEEMDTLFEEIKETIKESSLSIQLRSYNVSNLEKKFGVDEATTLESL